MYDDLQCVISWKVIALMYIKERLMSKFFSLMEIEKKMLYIECAQQEKKILIFETAGFGG